MKKEHDKSEKIQVVTRCEDCAHRPVCFKYTDITDITDIENILKSWHSPTNERITIESHYDVNIRIICPHFLNSRDGVNIKRNPF